MRHSRREIGLAKVFIAAFIILLLSASFSVKSFAGDARLSSGLRLINSRHRGETAAACLFIKTGYATEPADKKGITSLLCNCVLSMNPVDSANPPSLMIKRLGGKVTADVESDYTCFKLESPADSFPAALKALSEMVSGVNFSDDTVRIEKAAIAARNNFKTDNVVGRMYYAVFPAALPGDLKNISRKDLLAWRTARFAPGGALLSVCGPFSDKEVVKIAGFAFKSWPGSGKPYSREVQKPAFNAGKELELESEHGTAAVLFVFKLPPPGGSDYAAALTARAMLAGGMSSMIYKSLRGKEPKAYQFGSSLEWASSAPVMTVYSVTDESRIDDAVKRIKGSIGDLEDGKFSSSELERGEAFASGGADFSLQSAVKTAWLSGMYEIAGAGNDYEKSLAGEISGVGSGDVSRAARRYFRGYEIVTIRPGKEQK